MPQTTTGFLDALANYLGGVGTLSLAKGVNLFAENMIDDPDRVTSQVVLYDEGNEQVPEMRHVHLNWNIRVATARKVRLQAAEALRPVANHFVEQKRFLMTSTAGEGFRVVGTRMIQTPDVTERLDSGYFLASAVVQFQVLPL